MIAATWVGGGYINGTSEETYKKGLLAVQAPFCYAASLALGKSPRNERDQLKVS